MNLYCIASCSGACALKEPSVTHQTSKNSGITLPSTEESNLGLWFLFFFFFLVRKRLLEAETAVVVLAFNSFSGGSEKTPNLGICE